MFAIAIELLAERYTATQFNDRNSPEWPPHPARLYSAMVAAWADSDHPDPAERAALRWLEDQGAPAIHCSEERGRTIVTHFVPVNDPTALTRGDSWAQSTWAALQGGRQAVLDAERAGHPKGLKRTQATLAKAEAKAIADAARAGTATGRETQSIAESVLAVLPEHRGKQGRTYPTVIPDEPTVWFTWPDAQANPEVMAALDAVLGRVGRIGHSSTLVACRCTDIKPRQEPNWLPSATPSRMRVRVPRSGLLDRLEGAYETHHGEAPRTLPAGMVSYSPPGKVGTVPPSPMLGGDWYVLGFKSGKFPSAIQALAVARATRNALLAHADQPPPEILSGHQRPADSGRNGSTPPSREPHLAVVPLFNAGSRHSDGTIYGIALILPLNCCDEDRSAVETALAAWAASPFELLLPGGATGRSTRFELDEDLTVVDRVTEEHELEWLRTPLTVRRKTTRRQYWCGPAKRWLTVTPIALDRFPGNLRSRQPETRERAEAQAAAVIADACVYAGLAERAGDVTVTVRLDAPLVGVPASPGGQPVPGQRRYPGYTTGSSGIPRACVHAEIEFPGPVQGPVLIGAGRYLGYGLCLPRPARDRALKLEGQR